MGFLERFKGKKKISIEEALQKEQHALASREEKVLKFAYNSAMNICDTLQELRDMFTELSKKEVREERLKNQKALVDRFCSVGGEQIATLTLPEKNVAETKNFIERCHNLTKELGKLSPKEALRIKFFFEQDFSLISQKVKYIETVCSKSKEKFSLLEKHDELKKTEEEMNRMKAEQQVMQKQLASFNATVKEKERLINETEKELLKTENDTKGYEENEKNVTKKERTAMLLRQEIDSYLSISRLFKRLRHDNKLYDELLDKYIQNPSDALLKDEKLRICDFVAEALTLPIEDRKLIEKARLIEKKKLAQMRFNLVKTTDAIENEKHIIGQNLVPLRQLAEKLHARKTYLEKELQEINQTMIYLDKKRNSCRNGIEELDVKRKVMLEEVLGVEINS